MVKETVCVILKNFHNYIFDTDTKLEFYSLKCMIYNKMVVKIIMDIRSFA